MQVPNTELIVDFAKLRVRQGLSNKYETQRQAATDITFAVLPPRIFR